MDSETGQTQPAGVPGEMRLYVRIADELRERIMSGDIAKGDTLPPYSEICRMYNVSNATAQKAVRLLRDQGLVTTAPGLGTYVIATRPPAHPAEPWVRSLYDLNARVEDLSAELRKLLQAVDPSAFPTTPRG